jgi:pyridoxal phosphate enzyme (YggS family)
MKAAERQKELAARLTAVRRQLAAACERAGRAPGEVTLIAVSKTFPWEDIRQAYDLGLRDFGENYMQEARRKQEQAAGCAGLRWHFIGHLQRSKVRYWHPGFHLLHTLDSLELAAALDRKADREGWRLKVLVQVKLGDEVSKSGVAPAALPSLLAGLRSFPRLEVQGLMTIPPYMVDPEDSREYYRTLRELREQLCREGLVDPAVFRQLSMGMSHDFAVAVEEGATMVRVGSAIFGARSYA